MTSKIDIKLKYQFNFQISSRILLKFVKNLQF